MPHAKLTCPHCEATLKPGKPVAGGKTVKCPKCSEFFKAPPEPEPAPSKSAAGAAKSKVIAPPKKDDDDEGGVYLVVKDVEEEARKKEAEAREARKAARRRRRARGEVDEDDDEDEEDDEDEKHDVAALYLKNLKNKDPRGPAQTAVVKPSNWLLRGGLVGFLTWIAVLVAFLIPIVFPNIETKEDKDARTRAEANEKKGGDAQRKELITLKQLGEDWRWATAFGVSVFLGIVHAFFVCTGAVKMFNLESWNWGIASSILTIIPLHLVPTWYGVYWLFEWFLDDIAIFAAMGVWLLGPICGIGCILILKRPEVKGGYNYHPD